MKLRSNGKVQGFRMQQRMQLSGGRTLVFDEYGTTDGFPIVYMNGTPSSRKEWLLFGTDDMVGTARVRLIVPDRSGIGLSQNQPGRMITDWADDIRQLAVFLWQGGADTDATPAMAHYLVDQIPHAQLNFFEEEGHISLAVRHMSEILTTVVTPA